MYPNPERRSGVRFELARRLQEELGAEAPLLIALTGYGQEADRARTRRAGFAHHLVKPVQLDALALLLAPKLE
jgi:CheY-like chemotaxis protein